MAVYYVDDGGDGSDGSTWAKAYTSLSALDDAVTFASEDIVYIGHNHVCQFTHSANRTITGPTSGLPIKIISATQGSDPPTYAASTTDQVDTSEGSYSLTFDGSFALFGVRLKSGSNIALSSDSDEDFVLSNCTLALGINGSITGGSSGSLIVMENTIVDLTADGTSTRAAGVCKIGSTGGNNLLLIRGTLTFVNAGYRTNVIFGDGNSNSIIVSGADFSGFTNGTLCEIIGINAINGGAILSNCLTASTWAPTSGTAFYASNALFTNCGPANAPTYLYSETKYGACVSSTAIYRTGGATVESVACAWLIITTAACARGLVFTAPWIYGYISSTGSKTFDLYITNDTGDFTNAEVWLEVEYLGTATEAISSLATDSAANITDTAVSQTDDTTSTWNGTGPSFTYKQKLSVTATVNVAGLYRARVCVGKASIASSSYFYIDPKVTVS